MNEKIQRLPKWAQRHIEDLESENAKLRGLPDAATDVLRDLPPPRSSNEGLSCGWDCNIHMLISSPGSARSAVERWCSSSINHGRGWTHTTSQRPRELHSTEKRAYQALKSEFIGWATARLRDIDARIHEASDEPYKKP